MLRHIDLDRIAFNPNGQLLVAAGKDGTVGLWDLTTREQITTFSGHTGAINSVTFTKDGQLLATVSTDKTVVLWDIATRTRWATLSGHTDDVLSAAASPTNTQIATGSRDNTIIMWTINPSDAVARLCHKLIQDFPDHAQSSPPGCPA